jgi:Regulator of ribonuclease activity B
MATHPLDRETLDAMKASGADLSKPTEVIFYLYVPSRAAAEKAAAELGRAGYDAELRPPLPDYDEWLCCATLEMVPSVEGIDRSRTTLDALAKRLGGDFDGWEAAITK